jgi:hypothetical protein
LHGGPQILDFLAMAPELHCELKSEDSALEYRTDIRARCTVRWALGRYTLLLAVLPALACDTDGTGGNTGFDHTAEELEDSPALVLLGGLDNPRPGSLFEPGNVRDLAVGMNGRIHVLDALGHQVHVLDADGTPVHSFGRSGGGPGELSGPQAIAVLGDTVYVVDRTVERFRTSGEYLGSLRPLIGDSAFRRTERVVPAGPGGLALTQKRGSPRTRETLIVRFLDPVSGALGDPVVQLPMPENHPIAPGVLSTALFAPFPRISVAENGVVFSRALDGFEIDVLSPAGERIDHITADVPRIRVTDAEVRSRMRGYEQRGMAAADVPHAEFRPVLGRLLASAEGGLLVERIDRRAYADDGEPPDSSEWYLFSPDRRIKGRVVLSGRFTPYVLRGCDLVGVMLDDLDVPAIVRYRIAGGDGAALSCN